MIIYFYRTFANILEFINIPILPSHPLENFMCCALTSDLLSPQPLRDAPTPILFSFTILIPVLLI